MNNLTAILNSGGEKFVEFALPMLIQSSVLIVILLSADLLLRKKVRATFRYWLWMLVLVKLLLPPTLFSPVSFGKILGDKITAPITNSLAIVETKAPAEPPIIKPPGTSGEEKSIAVQPQISDETLFTVSAAAGADKTGGDALNWQAIVLVVWAGSAGAMVLLVIQRLFFVIGLIRQAHPAQGLLTETLEFCRKRMAVNLPVRLKVSANATSPAVCGLFHPVILVPQDIGPSLGVSHLRPVLMHELAHIKRGDLWVNLIQTVLQIIYFYNPLLWLANSMIRRVREQAVDEMVQVAMGSRAQDYPETLLNVAKLAFDRPALALRFIGVVESKSQLHERIKKMLNQPIPKTAKLGLAGLAAIIIAATVLLPMAAAQKENQALPVEITAEKAKELVEDFFKHNYRDITARRTIEWGEPEKDENGNVSIRYKYEATIWGKDKIIEDKVWTFDPKGNFLWVRKAGAEDIYSPAGAQALVENFFANNYRDITDRRTIEWDEPVKDENGNVTTRYKYQATIWGKDKIIDNKIFTFDKDGKYVSAKSLEGYPHNIAQIEVKNNVTTKKIDLLQEYPTTLQEKDDNPGNARAWDIKEKDIFYTPSFKLNIGNDLNVEIQEAHIGIGNTRDGAVWAVIIPENRGILSSSANEKSETIEHLWLRFHPAEINNIFKENKITQSEDKSLLEQMKRIARMKMQSSWQSNGKAMIPGRADMTVDADTKDGPRRFFIVDTEKRTAEYVSAFEDQSVPKVDIANHKEQSDSAPIVVSTSPVSFSNNVSPGLKYIEVTFDQEMMDQSWSWTGGGDTFPKVTGDPRYDNSRKTCRLPVELEPSKAYWVGINSAGYKAFQNKAGTPAPWYVIVFATTDAQGNPTPIPEDLLNEAKNINSQAEEAARQKDTDDSSEQIPYTQQLTAQIRPDGTIDFVTTIKQINKSNSDVTTTSFINSDFVEVTSMSDAKGSPIRFTTEHKDDIYSYQLFFNEPIKPGDLIVYSQKGTMTGLIKPVIGFENTYRYYMQHWPGTGKPTRRIETFILPKNAKLISTTPSDMDKNLQDGRIELNVDEIILPGKSITTAFEYSLATNGYRSKIELKYDDGRSKGKWSFSGGGHGVKFTAPSDGCVLKAVRLYGSRYGEYEAPKEDFDVWLCDNDFNIIKNFKFPYSTFAKRGYTKWATLKVDDVEVPKEFAICVAFDPHQTKGIYVYHDAKGSGHSYQGIPPDMKPFKDGDWMIRAVLEAPNDKSTGQAGGGSLQSMIDAAKSGGTLVVPVGRYIEPVRINKSLILKGELQNQCVFEVTADEPAVFVDTGGKGKVAIENLTVKWQLATSDKNIEYPFAMVIKDSRAEVRNCRFEPLGNNTRCPVALRVTGFSNVLTDSCRFDGFEYTVSYAQGTEGTIQDCVIANSGHQGIINYSGSKLAVLRNVITGSGYHALRSTGGRLEVKDNLIIANANRGIYLGNRSAKGAIENNVIMNNATGIDGFARSSFQIRNNIIADSTYAGIGMRDTSNLTIQDNILYKNERGLILFEGDGTGGNTRRKNTFWENKVDAENFPKAEDSLSANPGFANPDDGDFSLTAGPARDSNQGLTNPAVFVELWQKYKTVTVN